MNTENVDKLRAALHSLYLQITARQWCAQRIEDRARTRALLAAPGAKTEKQKLQLRARAYDAVARAKRARAEVAPLIAARDKILARLRAAELDALAGEL